MTDLNDLLNVLIEDIDAIQALPIGNLIGANQDHIETNVVVQQPPTENNHILRWRDNAEITVEDVGEDIEADNVLNSTTNTGGQNRPPPQNTTTPIQPARWGNNQDDTTQPQDTRRIPQIDIRQRPNPLTNPQATTLQEEGRDRMLSGLRNLQGIQPPRDNRPTQPTPVVPQPVTGTTDQATRAGWQDYLQGYQQTNGRFPTRNSQPNTDQEDMGITPAQYRDLNQQAQRWNQRSEQETRDRQEDENYRKRYMGLRTDQERYTPPPRPYQKDLTNAYQRATTERNVRINEKPSYFRRRQEDNRVNHSLSDLDIRNRTERRQWSPLRRRSPPRARTPTHLLSPSEEIARDMDDRERQRLNMSLDIDGLINKLENLHTGSDTTDTRVSIPKPKRYDEPPEFVTPYEQVLKGHEQEVEEQAARANTYREMAGIIIQNLKLDPREENVTSAKQLLQKSQETFQKMNQKREGLKKAKAVREYYRKPIHQPEYTDSEQHNTYFNARDIISVTGYFDPSQPDADFKHTWMKLTDYGTLQNFEEKHYMQALTIILRKEAYDAFCDLKERGNNDLTSIVDYFASVYAKKRSIAADRQAVDHFIRKKGETLITCMDRCKVAVERLRMTTSEQAWPETSRNLRRNILMQVIKEETARYVKMEEDEVYETTGLKYSFDKIVEMADRYERHHNSAPKEEVSTQYRAASGGLIQSPENVDKLKSQLAHLKSDQKQVQSLETKVAQLEELIQTQAVRFKNDGRKDENKERRKVDFETRRKDARSSSLDRGRDLSESKSPDPGIIPKEAYQPPSMKTDTKTFENPKYDSNFRTEKSGSRDFTSRTDKPHQAWRERHRTNSLNRDQRYRSRSPSYDRYKNKYRSDSYDKYKDYYYSYKNQQEKPKDSETKEDKPKTEWHRSRETERNRDNQQRSYSRDSYKQNQGYNRSYSNGYRYNDYNNRSSSRDRYNNYQNRRSSRSSTPTSNLRLQQGDTTMYISLQKDGKEVLN